MKKRSNKRFVSSIPAVVVATERAKQADAEAKIKVLGRADWEVEIKI